FGEKDSKIDLTDKNVSSFVTFKRDSTNNNFELLFSYGSRSHFNFGILNSRAYLVARDVDDAAISLNGTRALNDDSWHTIGVVYEKPILKLYTDGQFEKELEVE